MAHCLFIHAVTQGTSLGDKNNVKFSWIYRFGSRRVSAWLACGAIGTALLAWEAKATTSFSDLPGVSNSTRTAVIGSRDTAAQNESTSSTLAGMNPDLGMNALVANINGNLIPGGGRNITRVGEPGDAFALNIFGAPRMSGGAAIGMPSRAAMIIRIFTQSGAKDTIPETDSVFNATAFGVLYIGLCTITLMVAGIFLRRVLPGLFQDPDDEGPIWIGVLNSPDAPLGYQIRVPYVLVFDSGPPGRPS